jgi:RNA polymerase sigma-70 factor (ECF subfamily)
VDPRSYFRAGPTTSEKLLAEQARAALEKLPDLYREAFVLRDLEELDTSEVAGLLGVDAATVRQRVHRARLMLRGYLSHLVGART